MTITPSCVDEPECNGVIERFMRTLKEQSDFIARYNAEWLIERLSPDARGRADGDGGGVSGEMRSRSGVRIDDRRGGRLAVDEKNFPLSYILQGRSVIDTLRHLIDAFADSSSVSRAFGEWHMLCCQR